MRRFFFVVVAALAIVSGASAAPVNSPRVAFLDATCTGLPDGAFDAVVCVFGVFFAPDMAAFVQEMWRLVRPGGVLAITTWGPGLFEPASSHSWRCVGEVLATSLFGDVAAALREHVSATLD